MHTFAHVNYCYIDSEFVHVQKTDKMFAAKLVESI